MHPVALHVSRETLSTLPMPAIVQMQDPAQPQDPPHLAVLLRPEPDGVTLLDAPYAPRFMPESQFDLVSTGNTLVFAQDERDANRLVSTARERNFFATLFWLWLGVGALAAGLFAWRLRLLARGNWAGAAWRPICSRLTPGFLTVLSISLAGVAVLGWWIAADWNSHAICTFDNPLLDLGELPRGSNKHTVTIRNCGNSLLRIGNVFTTCSCAVV
jgi:hypothetical protein